MSPSHLLSCRCFWHCFISSPQQPWLPLCSWTKITCVPLKGDTHWAAESLTPLMGEVTNTDHCVAVECSAGKPRALTFVWVISDMLRPPKCRCRASVLPSSSAWSHQIRINIGPKNTISLHCERCSWYIYLVSNKKMNLVHNTIWTVCQKRARKLPDRKPSRLTFPSVFRNGWRNMMRSPKVSGQD